MSKRISEANSASQAGTAKELTVRSLEALGEQVLSALGFESGNPPTLWLYKDDSGDVHISRMPREGIRKLDFTNMDAQI